MSFKHKGLETFFKTGKTAGIQVKNAKRLMLILGRLHASFTVHNMNSLGIFLLPSAVNRAGIWSVRVSGN
jgi:proteic killer suppression protein